MRFVWLHETDRKTLFIRSVLMGSCHMQPYGGETELDSQGFWVDPPQVCQKVRSSVLINLVHTKVFPRVPPKKSQTELRPSFNTSYFPACLFLKKKANELNGRLMMSV